MRLMPTPSSWRFLFAVGTFLGASAAHAQAARPSITSLRPDRAEVGWPVTLLGANLDQVTEVRIGGVRATIKGKSGGLLTAIVPSVGAGAVPVEVSGGASPVTLQVFQLPHAEPEPPAGDPGRYVECVNVPSSTNTLPPPRVTRVRGPEGSVVTIHGSNLSGAEVRLSGSPEGILAPRATNTVSGDTQVSVLALPPAETGPACVRTRGGTAITGVIRLKRPRLTSMAPAAAPVGAKVVLGGQDFDLLRKVTLNGIDLPIDWRDGSRVQVTIPEGARGGVMVLHPFYGEGRGGRNFHVTPCLPTVTKAPHKVTVGEVVTVQGRCLGDASTEVYFNGIKAAPSEASQESLVVKVPEGATTGRLAILTREGASIGASVSISGAGLGKALPAAPAIGK